jgi:glycosyltransferase involved in cell wall biosynthesis
VVPCADAEFLEPCLASLTESIRLAAIVVPIVVVDDGSPARAATTVARDFGCAVVRHPHPTGAANARNAGVAALEGVTWILNFDADDVADPALLPVLADCARRAPKKVGVFYTRARIIGEEEGAFASVRRLPSWAIKDGNFLGANSMFRREAWAAVGGFDPGAGAREDWDFWIGVVSHGWRLQLVDRMLWCYRRHPASATHVVGTADWDAARAYISTKHDEFFKTRHDLRPQAFAWRVAAKARHISRQRAR